MKIPSQFDQFDWQWDKAEDKYAASSLLAVGVFRLWGSAGMILTIDRLPLVPSVLELVGLGWFAYKNIIFKSDREALVEKIKAAYKDITGSS